MESKKLDVKILGRVEAKRYGVTRYGDIYKEYEVIERPVIWEGQLDHPPFEEHDYIHLDSLDVTVLIKQIIRSTTNKFIYHTDYTVGELVEDDKTVLSLEEAKKKSAEIKQKYEVKEDYKPKKSKLRQIIDILKSK